MKYRIAVDGGLDFETVAQCARAGADTFISGTCLFARPNLKTAVARIAQTGRLLRRRAEDSGGPMSIKFGTDGWRAVIAGDFTFANLDRVTQAAADFLERRAVPGTENKIIVGYDRRFLSDQFGRRVGGSLGRQRLRRSC